MELLEPVVALNSRKVKIFNQNKLERDKQLEKQQKDIDLIGVKLNAIDKELVSKQNELVKMQNLIHDLLEQKRKSVDDLVEVHTELNRLG